MSKVSVDFVVHWISYNRQLINRYTNSILNLVYSKYRKWQKFQGWKVSRFAGFIRYGGKSFAIFSITTFIHPFMVFQLYKTATSVSMKALRSSRVSSLKLSLVPSEMDEKTLLTHVCECRFHTFQDNSSFYMYLLYQLGTGGMTTLQSQPQLKWVRRSLTASLLASSASYFLISWQKPSRFFAKDFLMVSTFSGAKV